MLFNSKSKAITRWIYICTLPLATVLVWTFGVEIVYAAPIFNNEIKVAHTDEELVPAAAEVAGEIAPEKALAKDTAKIVPVTKSEVKIAENSTSVSKILNDFYFRYPEVSADGEVYDVVKVVLKSGSWGSTDVTPNTGKVMIVINGIPYTEEAVKQLDGDAILGIKSISVTGRKDLIKIAYPELADKCDAVIELPSMSNAKFQMLNQKGRN